MEIPSLDDYRQLEQKIDNLEQTLLIITKSIPVKTWDVNDIAVFVGVDKHNLYKYKYMHHLPNYGKSDFAEGRARWKPETVAWWLSIPEKERIARKVS